MSMIIETPDAVKVLEDYDITFSSGMVMPITIDATAGDTIQFFDKSILVNLAAKPSVNNPDKLLPAETITIFLKHVVSIQSRQREVLQLSPEQQTAWAKVLQEVYKTNTVPPFSSKTVQ